MAIRHFTNDVLQDMVHAIRSKVLPLIPTKNSQLENDSGFTNKWTGTKAEYDALTSYDPNTIYITTDEEGNYVKRWIGTKAQYDLLKEYDPETIYITTDEVFEMPEPPEPETFMVTAKYADSKWSWDKSAKEIKDAYDAGKVMVLDDKSNIQQFILTDLSYTSDTSYDITYSSVTGNTNLVCLENANGTITRYNWNVVGNKQNKCTKASITVPVSSVNLEDAAGAYKNVTCNGVTSSAAVIAVPDPSSMKVWWNAGMYLYDTLTNGLIFKAVNAPTADVKVNVVVIP